MTERTETCKTCQWWDQWIDHPRQGLCRVHAPAPTANTEDPEEAAPPGVGWCSYPEWPATYEHDWCGEHAVRTPLAVVEPASEPVSEPVSQHARLVARVEAVRLKVAEVDSKLLAARQDIAGVSERENSHSLVLWLTVFVVGLITVSMLAALLAR